MSTKNRITSRRRRGRVLAACIAGLAFTGLAQAQNADTITLNVKDTELSAVLELLSLNTQKNIVASPRVSGLVTANFFDVSFTEALDAILTVNGFVWVEQENFIYVYTREEFAEVQARQRKTKSMTFELDYLSAADAQEFITPLLSSDGQASSRGDVSAGFEASASSGGADEYAYAARLVINDYEENITAIEQLLADLDIPPRQVLVESTIMQSALDESNAFGVDFSLIGSLDFNDLTNPLSAVNDLLSGNETGPNTAASGGDGFQPGDNKAGGASSTVGNTAGPAGLKVGVINGDFSVFLRALDEVTDTTVLARPKILALNRQRASVLVGQRIGYLSTTATETASTQTVEYLDTGIQLKFRPFISRSGMIRLELQPSVSEARLRNVTTGVSTVSIPDEITNELTTNVRVQDGETLVLGGLYRESNGTTRRQVPILGDIPILGAAFRGHEDVVRREEIIFLITPTVMDDSALWQAGETASDYANGLLVGSRSGLLPFSRTRQTESHNRKAVDAFERGDLDMAVFHTNNSLRLAPVQPEMRNFRDRILGTTEEAFQRSLMYRVLRRNFEGTGNEG
jgi:type IV pilus assembly protein PilQ